MIDRVCVCFFILEVMGMVDTESSCICNRIRVAPAHSTLARDIAQLEERVTVIGKNSRLLCKINSCYH